VKIGQGNAVGVAPKRFSTLSDIKIIITAMKREYSTFGLWVCGSRFFYLSLLCFNFGYHMSCPT
jgi:hypothetical protein